MENRENDEVQIHHCPCKYVTEEINTQLMFVLRECFDQCTRDIHLQEFNGILFWMERPVTNAIVIGKRSFRKEIVAMVLLDFGHFGTIPKLCNVATLVQFRGRGYASKLIQSVIEFSREQKPSVPRIDLDVQSWNTKALALYSKLDFRVTDILSNGVVVMSYFFDGFRKTGIINPSPLSSFFCVIQ
jgi:ribosomal protein S18 acetylase RimI-like enzyme